MAKIVEEFKTFRSDIREGDLVTLVTNERADGIYIVNSITPSGVGNNHCTIVKLETGEIFNDINYHYLSLYKGTVKLSNDE